MSPIAFILGAGSNIGNSTAALLKEKGYKVAIGSRNPDAEAAKKNGFFPVTLDVIEADSIKKAFATVNQELGAPSVIIYNAAFHNAPPDPADPLSLPYETFTKASSFGLGVFNAAQQALPGLRASDSPKAFIVTGNILPTIPPTYTAYVDLEIQKTIEYRLIDTFLRAYGKEDIRFYFASLVSQSGGIPKPEVFKASGNTHAKVYWELINQQQENWDYRFTEDGKKLEGY